MKYTAEMDSGATIYIPSFIKIGSGIQKLIGENSQTHRQRGDLISLLQFFSKKGRLKKRNETFSDNQLYKDGVSMQHFGDTLCLQNE
jgi:hypothetical protein